MKNENSATGTKFHYSRVRKNGDPTWFDPQTDIRQILPAALLATVSSLELQYEGTPEMDCVLYLHNCIRIFQIRVIEDPKPLDKQVSEFFAALASVPAELLFSFLLRFTSVVTCIYALFCRRDAVTDQESLQAMLEYARLASISDVLDEETRNKVKSDLQAAVPFVVHNRIDSRDAVVCHETGEVLERVKEIASRFLNCSGKCDWNAMSDACDKAFNAAGNGGRELLDKEAIALALAYPTYRHPTLTVTADGPSDKANTTTMQ